jgi:hypothetical protein
MFVKIKLLFLTLLFLFVTSVVFAEEQKIKEVKGLFSVATPQEGLVWGKVSNPQIPDTEGEIYICGKPSAERTIIVSVQKKKLSRTSSRIRELKRYRKEFFQQYESIIAEVIDDIAVPDKAPLSDQVPQGITIKTKDGRLLCCRYLFIFGENTCIIGVVTTSEKETKEIITCMAKSFRELATPPSDIFTEDGIFSVGKPSKEYTWKKNYNKDKDAVYYECHNDNSPIKILLFYIDKKVEKKEEQRQLLEFYAKQRVEQFKKDNYKNIKAEEALLSPYDDHEGTFFLKAKNSKGENISHLGVGIFENKTYVIEVFGPEKNKPLETCNKVINSFQELVKCK